MTPRRSTQSARTRERVLEAAAALAAKGGAEAVSIRAISAATQIQAPTIYRLFGNKQGLLDAVTEQRLEAHVLSHEADPPLPDPVDDLRLGWDGHVAYALAHPHLYRMTYVELHPGDRHPAAVEAEHRLLTRIRRIAEAGRLRVTPERALLLVEAAGAGTALTLLSQPEDRRDEGLSAVAREAIVATITTDGGRSDPTDRGRDGTSPPADGTPDAPATAATAARHLLMALPQVTDLTPAERALLREWLDRIAGHVQPATSSPAEPGRAGGTPG